MEQKVRHGIKLEKRKCPICNRNYFWVPQSSPQKFCSLECEAIDNNFSELRRPRARYRWSHKRKFFYKLKEEDYE